MVRRVNDNILTVYTQPQKQQMMTSDQKKLMKACQDFEAIMVQKMLEVMQGSTKMFGEGFGGDYFQSMFQEEMSKQIAQNGQGIGLAKMLYQQMNKPVVVPPLEQK